MLPVRYQVVDRRRETHDTVSLTLAPHDEPLAPPAAGTFMMLWVFGVGEVAISVSATEGDHLVHTVRAAGAVTRALCQLEPGDTVGVRGPFGSDWGVDGHELDGRPLVVVAGGLGLAPVRSAIRVVSADPDRFGPLHLVVGARSPEDLLYPGELDRWRRQLAGVHVTVDRPAPGWTGEVGVVTELLGRVPVSADTVALVCGPEIMLRYVAEALVGRGVEPTAIRVSLERSMACAVTHCGRCQLGPLFVCREGPVVAYATVADLLRIPGL